MNFIKQIERIQRINKHIYNEKSGRPDEFARRMGISKRQLYNIIEMLKDFDAPIRYDRNRETFFYDSDFNLDIRFSMRILTDQEDKSIFGGCFSKNLLPCNFISRNPNNLALTI
ncbi:MAG: hypothetical protein GY870_10135 [archaeon]|nr:hypothetical protein [archaeon]